MKDESEETTKNATETENIESVTEEELLTKDEEKNKTETGKSAETENRAGTALRAENVDPTVEEEDIVEPGEFKEKTFEYRSDSTEEDAGQDSNKEVSANRLLPKEQGGQHKKEPSEGGADYTNDAKTYLIPTSPQLKMDNLTVDQKIKKIRKLKSVLKKLEIAL